jgi:hypothetical protein
MARFEVILSSGEKIVVDHPTSSMAELVSEFEGKDFLTLTEIIGASAAGVREIIVASGQITLIRPLSDQSTQGSNFRPKR